MKQYIDKNTLKEEIERLIETNKLFKKTWKWKFKWFYRTIIGRLETLEGLKAFLDTLEAKEAETWHLQEKENIYDAVKDWGHHTFACIMKDGTIQKFTGSLDEDCEGHINVHIDGVNDDYDNVDDIVKWIEYT